MVIIYMDLYAGSSEAREARCNMGREVGGSESHDR
jgi:hypothetical protein